jgi:hypothetical protein
MHLHEIIGEYLLRISVNIWITSYDGKTSALPQVARHGKNW